ncbi:MAG: hypothetical protein NVS3B3_20580 [Aquirhabdus sp.]
MFLSKEEIKELTGYAYASKQIEWLRNHQWKFEVNAQQIPKVARSYCEVRMGGHNPKQTNEMMASQVRPNFQVLNQMRAR